MNVPWIFSRGKSGTSASTSKNSGKKGRRQRHAANPNNPPIFELAPLERRLFLSFSPGISAAPSALGGVPTTLNLTSTGSTAPVSWSIDWGVSGQSPQLINNPGSSITHTYANTSATYKISATAYTGLNQTGTASAPLSLGLDTSFNSSGKVLTDLTTGIDSGYATAVDPYGKILVAGVYNGTDFVIARYNTDGTRDTTFGDADSVITGQQLGYARLDLSGNSTSIDKAYAIAIQSDGKIVLAGTTNLNAATSGYDFAVARFTTSGTLDTDYTTGFGATVGTTSRKGFTTIDFGTGSISNDQVNAIAIDLNNNIVVAGSSSTHTNSFAVARLNSHGALDTAGFNSGGGAAAGTKLIAFPNSSQTTACQAIVLEPYMGNQRIVLGGYAYGPQVNGVSQTTDFALTRLNSDGSLDNAAGGFGSAATPGYVLTDFSVATGSSNALASSDSDFSLVLENDAALNVFKLVAGGSDNPTNSSNSDFAASRYNLDGQPDTDATHGFGAVVSGSTLRSGKVTIDFAGGTDVAYASAIQADGKILLGGVAASSTAAGTGSDFALARLNFDGSLDTTFGNGGKLTTDFNSGATASNDVARSMSLMPDGRIVVTGSSTIGSNGQIAIARYQPINQITVLSNNGVNNLAATSTGSSVDLTWTATAPLFEIYRWQGTGTPVQIGTTTTGLFHDNNGGVNFQPGNNYFYQVTADFGGGSTFNSVIAASTATLTVAPDPSTPVSTAPNTSTPNEGGYATLKGLTNDLITLTGTQLSVDWGDGSVSNLTNDASHFGTYSTGNPAMNGLTATHLYAQGGTYTAVMSVTDNAGESQSALFGITEVGVNPSITTVAGYSNQTLTTADLSVAASGTGPLTYSWSIVTEPTNAPDPSFSLSAASTTATFYQAGDYTLEVTATNAYGGLFNTSDVSIHFDQKLSSIADGPAPLTVPANTTYQLFAKTLDQFGNAMATQQPVSWHSSTGSPRGSIDIGTGVYTAPTSAGGTDTFSAYIPGVDSLPGSFGNDIVITIGPTQAQPGGPPSGVVGVAATANGDGSANVSWNAGNTADGFLVEASNDGGTTFSPIGTAAMGASVFNATNQMLIGNANYVFKVTPYNGAGLGLSAVSGQVLTTVPQTVPADTATPATTYGIGGQKVNHRLPAPKKLFATNRSVTGTPSQFIYWAPIKPATGSTNASYIYYVWRATILPTPKVAAVLLTIDPSSVISGVPDASGDFKGWCHFEDRTVEPGKTYRYWVETSKGLRFSDASKPVDALQPAAAGVAAVTSLKVATTGGSATALPTGQALTWTWNGSGTPTWVIVRSDGQPITATRTLIGGSINNGTWQAIDQTAIQNVADPIVFTYTVTAVVGANGQSAPSLKALAPQVYMMLGSGNHDGTSIAEALDFNTHYELHWFESTDTGRDLTKTAINKLPKKTDGTTAVPIVLSGISFGGGQAVGMTYTLPKVDYLALFDPVCPWPNATANVPPNCFPYYVGYPKGNTAYSDNQLIAPANIPVGEKTPYSDFYIATNANAPDGKPHLVLDANDWYNSSSQEFQYYGADFATGSITNYTSAPSGHTWKSDIVGTFHVSQIDPRPDYDNFQTFKVSIMPTFTAKIGLLTWNVVS